MRATRMAPAVAVLLLLTLSAALASGARRAGILLEETTLTDDLMGAADADELSFHQVSKLEDTPSWSLNPLFLKALRPLSKEKVQEQCLIDLTRMMTYINSSQPFWACVAPKTGCTGFKNLFGAVNVHEYIDGDTYKNDPVQVHLLLTERLEKGWSAPALLETLGVNDLFSLLNTTPRVIFVRNPYVRFASSYLDWLGRNGLKEADVTFTDFLTMAEQWVNGKPFGSPKVMLPDHIWAVSRTCMVELFEYNVILRLEEMGLWYNDMIELYGLRSTVSEMGKRNFKLYETSLNIDDPLRYSLESVFGFSAWPGKPAIPGHAKNAVSILAKIYGRDTAARVFDLMRADFEQFGYPAWNGNIADFRFA
uniref:Sulfotransferase n=1 Tax=Chlamydomonas euryale TaxID=1486919 RepID=A0A7R9VA75_9CHLO|mmetsp:Transcript_28118/g.83314  ORF Transcript_28118/g.83314 Transcript_28118/m.83314 type:complete len:365 (+) Transcript_28118:1414-2508(+)